MSTPITEKTLKYLAELARIDIKRKSKKEGEKNEKKLLKDLQKILGYFEELKEINTEDIEPLVGGTIEKNVFRQDEPSDKRQTTSDKLIEAFPEKKEGYLRVPPVFE